MNFDDFDLVGLLNNIEKPRISSSRDKENYGNNRNLNSYQNENNNEEVRIFTNENGRTTDDFLESLHLNNDNHDYHDEFMSNTQMMSSNFFLNSNNKSTPNYILPTTSSVHGQHESVLSRRSLGSFQLNIEKENVQDNNFEEDCGNNENVIKSLRLRIQGQVKTIRQLEHQLQQVKSNELDKERELQTALNKIKLLESRERSNRVQRSSVGTEKFMLTNSLDSKTVERLQNHVKDCEEKITSEISRRARAEERSRTIKEQLDRIKSSLTESESRCLGLQRVVEDLQTKTGVYKKRCKELVLETQNSSVSASELARLAEESKLRTNRAETLLRQALTEIESMKEQAKGRNEEYTQNQMKMLSQLQSAREEIASLKERLSSRRAEEKLKQVVNKNGKQLFEENKLFEMEREEKNEMEKTKNELSRLLKEKNNFDINNRNGREENEFQTRVSRRNNFIDEESYGSENDFSSQNIISTNLKNLNKNKGKKSNIFHPYSSDSELSKTNNKKEGKERTKNDFSNESFLGQLRASQEDINKKEFQSKPIPNKRQLNGRGKEREKGRDDYLLVDEDNEDDENEIAHHFTSSPRSSCVESARGSKLGGTAGEYGRLSQMYRRVTGRDLRAIDGASSDDD